MRVTIVGGGVIGLCCAHYLNKQGYSVTVIDKGDLTDGCSFGNMGFISPSHFIPLASPGIVAQGLKWMLSSTSPFYIKPRLNADLLKWGLQFWKSSSYKTMSANVPHLNNLLQLSRQLMNDLQKELNGLFTMIEKGCWMLYKNPKTGEHEKVLAEQAAELGLKTIICTAQQVQGYEPEVEVNVAGGVLYPDDCHINTRQFMQGLHSSLEKDGVKFYLHTEITGFEKNSDKVTAIITNKEKLQADEVVIANGSWMPQLSKKLGIYLLMQPGKGYSVDYDNLQQNLRHPAILVDDRVASTPIGKWLRIGGTMELSGHRDNILPKRVMAIYKAFKKYFPSMELASPDAAKAWYGYRPVTPDGLPYIGKHRKWENVSFAGGHAMLGVSAAAATGQLITEIISNRQTSIDVSAFDVQRFSN